MFHVGDNPFFGRMEDGSVRILKLPEPRSGEPWPKVTDDRSDAMFDVYIHEQMWVSVIDQVGFNPTQTMDLANTIHRGIGGSV